MSGTLSPVLAGFDTGWEFTLSANARKPLGLLRLSSVTADRKRSRRDGAPTDMSNADRIRRQDRAITPQESDIAASGAAHTLSITPETLPAGAEIAAMPATTAATSSPSARGGALAWLRNLVRALVPGRASKSVSTLDTPRLTLRASELRGFREFTAPRRMQLGAATPMRARAFGQRASLHGLSRRSRA